MAEERGGKMWIGCRASLAPTEIRVPQSRNERLPLVRHWSRLGGRVYVLFPNPSISQQSAGIEIADIKIVLPQLCG
jgi:hypothetical protein